MNLFTEKTQDNSIKKINKLNQRKFADWKKSIQIKNLNFSYDDKQNIFEIFKFQNFQIKKIAIIMRWFWKKYIY